MYSHTGIRYIRNIIIIITPPCFCFLVCFSFLFSSFLSVVIIVCFFVVVFNPISLSSQELLLAKLLSVRVISCKLAKKIM